MYFVESSSPFDPGARPSNSSDARILMCDSNASGVMTSRAGLSFSATLSSAKRKGVNKAQASQHKRRAFIVKRVVAVPAAAGTELKDKRLEQTPLQQKTIAIPSNVRLAL